MASTATDVEPLLEYIKSSRGFDFTGYKRPSLTRRIRKRIEAVGVDSYEEYQAYLAANEDEYAELFNTILINVTGFFRDSETWEFLRDEVIPRLVEEAAGAPLRIWSTGCATGEEAYTLAILFAEALGEEQFRKQVKIYATDVDEDALAIGRLGRYARKHVDDVPEDLRLRYFDASATGTYAFRADLRRAIIFGRHDLV